MPYIKMYLKADMTPQAEMYSNLLKLRVAPSVLFCIKLSRVLSGNGPFA